MITDPFAVIAQRQHTHGAFRSTAWVSSLLKDVFRHEPGWENLTPVHREAMDCIALKLARILSGDANHPDHWVDIQGYAELALREIAENRIAAK